MVDKKSLSLNCCLVFCCYWLVGWFVRSFVRWVGGWLPLFRRMIEIDSHAPYGRQGQEDRPNSRHCLRKRPRMRRPRLWVGIAGTPTPCKRWETGCPFVLLCSREVVKRFFFKVVIVLDQGSKGAQQKFLSNRAARGAAGEII